MRCLPGAPEGGPGGGVDLEDIGRLTGLFPGGPGGTLSEPGDDSACPGNAAGETCETRHNCLGGGHVLATVAHNLDIIGIHRWLVAYCYMSC
jgi:hypothetical protein